MNGPVVFLVNSTLNPNHFDIGLPIQSGSEIQPFEIQKHSKSRLFGDRISNSLVLKESGYGFSYSYGPNHLKTGPIKIQTFLSVFQMAALIRHIVSRMYINAVAVLTRSNLDRINMRQKGIIF